MRALLVALVLVPAVAAAAPGTLDPTFGGDGIVVGSTVTAVVGLAAQSDGGIVVATREPNGTSSDSVLRRWHADGTPDASFGDGGTVRHPGAVAAISALVVAAGDALVVAADRCDAAAACVATLRRYGADGQPDAGFPATEVQLSPPTLATALVAQPDGTLVLGGSAGQAPAASVWLARRHADGTPDATFGADGAAIQVAASAAAFLDGLVVEPGGTLLAGITDGAFSSLLRLTAAGGDAGGRAIGFARPHLALGADGAILAAGLLQDGEPATARIAVARFLGDLAPDPGFGGGTVAGAVGVPFDALVEPDGRLVVAGCLGPPNATRFALLRWSADGSVDGGFGDGGSAVLFPDRTGIATRVVRQADGRLMAAGFARVSPFGGQQLVLARFTSDTPPPSTVPTTLRPASTTTTTTLPGGCGACDDGDPCTEDRCEAAGCVSAPLPDFAGVSCVCAQPLPACGSRPGRRVVGLARRACTLLARAAGARPAVAYRRVRRADRLLTVAARRLVRGAGAGCERDPAPVVRDLGGRAEDLLGRMR